MTRKTRFSFSRRGTSPPVSSGLGTNKPMRKRRLMKLAAILLTAAMLLPLWGCGRGQRGEREPAEASAPPQSYLSAQTDSSFPLGLNACIQGLAATGNYIFAGGVRNEVPALVRIEYSRGESGIKLGESQRMELPDCPDGTQLLNLSSAADRLYVLLGIPDEEGKSLSCRVLVYSGEDSPAQSLDLDWAEEEYLLSILALEDGGFLLRDTHHLRHYSAEGALIAALEQEREDFYPPLLLEGEPVIWLRDAETGRSTLNAIASDGASLEPLAELGDIGAPRAYIQSRIGRTLVSDVSGLYRINPDYSMETVFEWYPLTGDYGQNYRYICQLEENVFLVVSRDSAELRRLVLTERIEDRPVIRLGFYGVSEGTADYLTQLLGSYNREYRVEAIDCGRGEAALSKLLAELAAGDKLDILVTGCDSIAPSNTFVDLYQFLDRDEELSREDFLPKIMDALETDGELRQIWNSFATVVPLALGPLAEGPKPLRLADCQDYLDSRGYDGILFSTPLTAEDLFEITADALLADSWQEERGEYRLDRQQIRELVELCRSRPMEAPPLDTLTEEDNSLVFRTGGVGLEGIIALEKEQQPYRLFDGSDGGDNCVRLMTAYGTCFMIPETCKDPESAWGFLRTLLLPGTQLKFYEDRALYPVNVHAFETLLDSCEDSQVVDAVRTLVERGTVRNYDAARRREILLRCLEPCLYGDYDIERAIDDAQGRLNLYAAERQN